MPEDKIDTKIEDKVEGNDEEEVEDNIEGKTINCNTHIFTGDHVPSFIAKTYVPKIFKLFNLKWIVRT